MLRTTILFFGLLAVAAANAQQGFISIEVNGAVITTNESTQASIGNFQLNDYANLSSYQLELNRAVDANRSIRELVGGTVVFSKPLGASSVLLRRAIDLGETVSATVRFFGNHPDTGEAIEVYRAEFINGTVAGIVPWYKTAGSEPAQLYEAVTVLFASATFEHEQTSILHQIDFTATP